VLLVFVGVLNLLFALACGCFSGSFAAGIAKSEDLVTQGAFQEQLEDVAKDVVREMGNAPSNIRRVVVDAFSNPKIYIPAHTAAVSHPAMRGVRMGSLVAALAQGLLLIGSIMLLTRRSAGRTLSILALTAFIVASIWAALQADGPIKSYGETAIEHLPELESYQALSEPERREVEDYLGDATRGMPTFGVVLTSIANIWPILSLLILLMSRSIREACAARAPAS
jgi:hypothetical protein